MLLLIGTCVFSGTYRPAKPRSSAHTATNCGGGVRSVTNCMSETSIGGGFH
ncbi:Uncharacterised protein [Mycobacterium tuberculosis]|uniref:Uncharacterized protein n=1 Tax=Mycobacterium tuberculosis TaxID=1773 RepID=A0A0T7PMY3_MYCTX|nr:Uncharacterised protein [Mycobacterium tuberculosis]CKR71066.1 Uncharacterised protein [Mycobacterium tuberculosis]COX43898.1 Uncharacterised protein [Mycobacterium tuberculosis]COX43911.1 Uncharacterised protein [Mycobacterium tuberculosis]COX81856.1 Uncharacterised protein [Mycobacterium tuberculosis]